VGRPHLLEARLGGVLDRLGGCDQALVVIGWTRRTSAPELGRPSWPAEVAGRFLRAEERIQQASMVRLGRSHLVLPAMPQTCKLLAARAPSLRRVDGGDQQQGHDEAESGRDRQQPALRIPGDGVMEDRDLTDCSVLPD
jgi:hypothetical protein